VSTAEPDEVVEPTAEPAAKPPRTRRRWPWVVVLVLSLAAVLGVVVGASIVLRGRSFGAPRPLDAAVRPTFIVATAPSPSPIGSPQPVAPPLAIQSDEYTVGAGDTLRSIAARVYGDPAQWARIYDANRAAIGPDPDAISAGMRLRIPRP